VGICELCISKFHSSEPQEWHVHPNIFQGIPCAGKTKILSNNFGVHYFPAVAMLRDALHDNPNSPNNGCKGDSSLRWFDSSDHDDNCMVT